jgi:hypothetical protein
MRGTEHAAQRASLDPARVRLVTRLALAGLSVLHFYIALVEIENRSCNPYDNMS